ncbi:MAG: phospho-sugar mutase [Oscillospiraceae bacterium]|nr:phospho-sugar mutase [Oscillospiraceae bacterium]
MNLLENYERWLRCATADPALQEELQEITGQASEIEDRFYRELEFGTAGLRGVLGAGTNRMNVYTVGRATQGYCAYLLRRSKDPSVAIAYDSRRNSTRFAEYAASIFAGNGIRVHLYRQLMPTPCLSFAVRYFHCDGGINVTASHNPAQYNGYKVYGPDGCQITSQAAEEILSCIAETDMFDGVKTIPLETALERGIVSYIGEEAIEAYLQAIDRESLLDDAVPRDFAIVYTPLNGAGISCVPQSLARNGFTKLQIPEAQKHPNGDFPTCPYPNPEIRQTLDVAIRCAEETGAAYVLATDPDCDRVGTAVKVDDTFHLISGNQMGVLLLDYICRMRLQRGRMPAEPVAVKTIVTTKMAERVAAHYGVRMFNVLTGFKYIGEQIALLERQGGLDRYIFGFEESYGYLSGTEVRDKDAVNSSLLICEMFAWYRAQGKTPLDGLQEAYQTFGCYTEKLMNFTFEGAAGFRQMQRMMGALRERVFTEIAGIPVETARDYLADGTGLPKADVMQYHLKGGTVVTVRPSGTEPKLKIYLSACGETCAHSAEVVAALESALNQWVEKVKARA